VSVGHDKQELYKLEHTLSLRGNMELCQIESQKKLIDQLMYKVQDYGEKNRLLKGQHDCS